MLWLTHINIKYECNNVLSKLYLLHYAFITSMRAARFTHSPNIILEH